MTDGVLYFDQDGALHEQKAEIVVLASNGIGTPRLLLNSANERYPDGLANSSGLVGKNLMFHPYAMIRGVFDEPLEGRGPGGCSIWSHEFYETDRSRGFVRGFSYEMARGTGPASAALFGASRGKIPWGPGHHEAHAEFFEHSAGMVGITEDLPGEANTVTLDPELTDGDGIPAPKITYEVSENSHRQLTFAEERGHEVLRAAGRHGHLLSAPHRAGRLAPDGHREDGDRPDDLGRQRMGSIARREEPLHHRRKHLRDCGRGESDLDDSGARAVRG